VSRTPRHCSAARLAARKKLEHRFLAEAVGNDPRRSLLLSEQM
jgi:hypothetical protein